MRVVSGSLQLLGQAGTHHGPAGVDARTVQNGGIGQVIVQHTATVCPRPAKRRLHVIFDFRRHRVDALSQRVQRAGQRPRRMDGAGAAFKKAAVSGPGVGGQAQGGQQRLRGQVAFAERSRHDAGRQPQPPGDAVQIVPGQHQIPPSAAAAAAPGAGKVKAVPCRNARQVIPVLTAAAGFHDHSGTSQGLERPAAKSVSSSKPLRTMLATFTSV